ncbi:META domain-containing protein [Streptomyces fulvoviolaceus]|uniref:META domain-containing protein n=1 Tax=Streptomyces fulvoviolaceus TaxID=285535 RepID=UPI0006936F53|nr:META domain-containing protein [Streptomyces fulvoviolaceus]MCT9079686.1 META domain-containing protein [Streptomyces fulvoviolaceus]
MDKLRLTLAVLTALPLAVACGSEKADPGSGEVGVEKPVTGTRWNIETVTVDGKKHEAATDTHLTFDKKTGKVGGRLGCNHVNAKATVSDGHITLGAPSTTRMMCEASLMDTEKTLLSLFDSKLSYRVDQHSLALTSANGDTLRAVAAE